MPYVLGYGAVYSVVMTAFEYTGGSLRGPGNKAVELEEYDRKEHHRLNRRRPVEETIAHIGEGRGKFFFSPQSLHVASGAPTSTTCFIP